MQKKAIVWGTLGAIVVRSAMTVGVVWLLQIPGLMLAGGLGLLWIAYKLLADNGEDEHAGPVAHTFWGAMKTIVVADALMGIDNVLGVAGAAHGSFDLVIIGLLISVPIVVFGSSMVLRLVQRFPLIIKLGAAVLAFTAARMIVGEPLLDAVFDPRSSCTRPPAGRPMPPPWPVCWAPAGGLPPAATRRCSLRVTTATRPEGLPVSPRPQTTLKGSSDGQDHCVRGRCSLREAATDTDAGNRPAHAVGTGGVPGAPDPARPPVDQPFGA